MIAEHLPALQVVVPLVCAPAIVLVRRLGAAWAIATLASWSALAIAIALALQVAETGPISYAIGSWPPPWGIEYRVDPLSAFVLILVSLVGAIAMPYAKVSIAAELPQEQEYLFFAMYCLCLCGLLGITITGDAFNLFVFLEISSLSTYVLIALGKSRRALAAAYQYLVMGTIGATFYVIGIGLLYLMTGTLNLADMAERLAGVHEVRPQIAAVAFVTVGIGLKLALFPLHQWLPNAYTHAPSVVTAFLAATATKVSIYVLIRFYFSIFRHAEGLREVPFQEFLLGLAILAIVSMSLVALFQDELKRMLAYSSVAQVGYIMLGVSLASPSGLTAATTHLFNHGVTKGALFFLVGLLALRCGSTRLSMLSGIASRMPVTALGIVLAGLSLIGVPGTAGFVTKWYLVRGSMERGSWWLAALIVATSLIALGYVWRFVEVAYLREPGPEAPRKGEPPLWMLGPAGLLVAACFYFGVETSFNVGFVGEAVRLLLRQSGA
ncbi:MAG TPA: monovalent cation/H+ antiporter subunit D family protein [Burkholderiales bacterium]|nr:monovalent cation/H+ antiporter subunit D family protein [Burkholderiales bacterium]